MLDLVHRLHDAVQGRVRADAELRAGQVVVDGGRQADHRDIEGREVRTIGQHIEGGLIGIPTPDHEQCINVMILDDAGHRVQVASFRNKARRPQRRAAA